MTVIAFYKKYPFLALILISSILFGCFIIGKKTFFEHTDPKKEHYKTNQKMRVHGSLEFQIRPETISKPDKLRQEVDQAEKNNMPQVSFLQREKKLEKVDDNYLDGALFIGDSRTTILHEYAKWERTDFFVKNGLSVWDVNEVVLNTVGGNNQTLEQVLTGKQYPKIYIMLGINELGTGSPEKFAAQYLKVIDSIRKYQPESLVFLQEIIHVTSQKDAEGSYINNAEVDRRNEELRKICDGKQVIYLAVNETFDLKETKTLDPALTGDGVHIQAKNIERWKQYLLSHGVVFPSP